MVCCRALCFSLIGLVDLLLGPGLTFFVLLHTRVCATVVLLLGVVFTFDPHPVSSFSLGATFLHFAKF